MSLKEYEEKVYTGQDLQKEEAMLLIHESVEELAQGADRIRKHFCGSTFDLCSIINGKSGACSENCAFCAQSAHHKVEVNCYPLLQEADIMQQAKHNDEKGVHRFSIVTSGRTLSKQDLDQVCQYNKHMIKETSLHICASHGLLSKKQLLQLKESGVSRYHNNLETSRCFFPFICTTHTYDEKIETLKNAIAVGLEVCSGGIIGLGESMEDRIDLALTLRELKIHSIPINILNPIEGTPLMHMPMLKEEEIRKTIAIFRFLLPSATLRLAGGRGALANAGKCLFEGGANAMITGDMLTTDGVTIDRDKAMLKELGYKL